MDVDKSEKFQHYVIDRRASRFIVRAFAGGIGAALGYGPTLTIGDFWGEADCDPADLASARLSVTIQAASIVVADDMREDDRRHLESAINQEILKTSKFPQVSFLSSRLTPVAVAKNHYRIEVEGDLTLNGMTRPHRFVMQASLSSHDVRVYGDFALRQSEYDIPQVTIAGGLLQLQDELRFSFYILARPQDSASPVKTAQGEVTTR